MKNQSKNNNRNRLGVFGFMNHIADLIFPNFQRAILSLIHLFNKFTEFC